MEPSKNEIYRIAADAILLLHASIVAFVVFGLLFILTGKMRGWRWVCNPWFRAVHLAAISVVIVQSWFGLICPLTTIEMQLRLQAGDTVYNSSFISHWLGRLLYYQLPPWVFTTGYMLFGVIVIASWFWVRPRRFSNND